jgi:hypothetical protein
VRGRGATPVVVAALGSLTATAAGIVVSLATSDQWPDWLQPYRRWGWWVVLGLMLAAAGLAAWQARRQAGASGNAATTADRGADVPPDGSVTGAAGPPGGRDVTIHPSPTGVPVTEPAAAPRELGPVSNLPPRNPNFTGRQEILDALARNLRVDSVATLIGQPPNGQAPPAGGGVQALAGMGGVGKTQLALEYAHRHATDYDLRWWVPSEEPLAMRASLAALGRRLGLGEHADQEETVAKVLAELGRRHRWLLVFDNAVHPRELEGYRPAGNGGHVLVTTRTRAFGGVAARLEVGVFAPEEAAAFLLARTGASDPAVAEELAGELGELPLALEQAAAFMEQTGLSIREYQSI